MPVWQGDSLAVDENVIGLPVVWRGAELAIDENIIISLAVWQGDTLAIDENTISQPDPTQIHVWDGTQWVRKPFYRWNGSNWTQIT